MQSYDNHANLVSEINTRYTSSGRVITTTTSYDTYHPGRVAYQNIEVRDLNTGKVSSERVLGGKLLP
jgi:hypothetical protein